MPLPFLSPDTSRHLEAFTAGTEIEHFLGGATALPRMLADIRSATGAHSFVYHAAWNCECDLAVPVEGGTDTLGAAVHAAAQAGAQIRMLLWLGLSDQAKEEAYLPLETRILLTALRRRELPPAAHNGDTARLINGWTTMDAHAYLDGKTLLFGSHHQKILLVGTENDVIAYVGGIEFSTDRLHSKDLAGNLLKGAPLFDISLRVTGTAAYSVLRTFAERWSASAPTAMQSGFGLRGESRAPPPSAASGRYTDMLGAVPVGSNGKPYLNAQTSHTYGKGCPFSAPIQTARQAIATVISSTKQFFYMEDQYYVGTDELAAAIRAALNGDRSRWGVVVIAAEDSVADLPDVGFRRRAVLRPLVEEFRDRLWVFERKGDDGKMTGPTAYVHSKLTIVDDVVAVVGSANTNYRSWTHDSEMMLTLAEPSGAGGFLAKDQHSIRALRTALWERHLTAGNDRPPDVSNPARARESWKEVLVGKTAAHVRPYDVSFVPIRPLWTREPVLEKEVWQAILDPRAPN